MTKTTSLEVLKNGLKFYRNAQTIYDIQSPFLYSLLIALKDKSFSTNRSLLKIEKLRAVLKKNKLLVEGIDYGAGSRKKGSKNTIGSIIKTASSTKKAGIILHNLVKFSNAAVVLELGTNLGIGTSYLASAGNPIVYTIEGNKGMVEIARQNFSELGLKNVKSFHGTFKDVIPQLSISNIDLIFIDGHHNGQATIEYVEMLRPLLNTPGLIVLDDINWSTDMKKAFHYLIRQPYVSSYLDLFHKGILIFNPNLVETPGIQYIPYFLKPWRIGLWGGKQL